MKYVWFFYASSVVFLRKQRYLVRLNLEKAILKAENETTYSTNDHLWRSKLCPRTENTLPLRKAKEAQVSVSREKGRERESNILFHNPWVFDIFVLLPAIIMQYLYGSVKYALKVWVSFKDTLKAYFYWRHTLL